MNSLQKVAILSALICITTLSLSCKQSLPKPTDVRFHTETLIRIGGHGDNWCITWTHDGSQVTSMCDGNWLNGEYLYHNHLYRIVGEAEDFTREDISHNEMFFMEESGQLRHGERAYPFSFCSFVQNGQANSAARDGHVYIYSPEGAQSNHLLLARVKHNEIEKRNCWEYFASWDGGDPLWTDDLDKRGIIHEFPAKNDSGECFGWYSWLPSIVWNEGLGLYIMVNGGTYAGPGLSGSRDDYYHRWMHTKTGSLGFWFSENPYGPWHQFFYLDYWIVDDEKNRTYQPKLSPKWISEDGTRMVLIWSDAMRNKEGRSHTVNYRWNQMEITLEHER
ncbi:MAG: hypothetical protein AMS26_22845 [Bacteroides sp. SM23_62]|nr:MAG: hypothetical protein AMS26_22845 [Bacteroides sp. SM23_62]